MVPVNNAWIFDVDGVITDPQEKKITEPEILEKIIKILNRNEPVALNTGRSFAWLIDRVINLLVQKLGNKGKLNYLFSVGEFGGVWMTVNEDGTFDQKVDSSLTISPILRQQVKTLVQNDFSESMFYDEEKITMLSVEMKYQYSLEEFKRHQEKLINNLSDLLKTTKNTQDLQIHEDVIATNIMNRKVGKKFATQRILRWSEEKNIRPKRFIAFGDNNSDFQIAEEIRSQGLSVMFAYVGKENIDTTKYPFPIKTSQEKYGKGTLEILKML